MTSVGIVTQARMTSTRLPGKIMLEADGSSMLDHHLTRLAGAEAPVIVATTVNDSDDPVAAAGERRGVAVFRGSEHDVLSRYAGVVRAFDLDVVVRVTSDCPLVDGAVVRRGIDRYLDLDDPYAYVSNVLERTYPRGFDFEVFSASALLEADARSADPQEREHVTPYLHRNRSGRTRFETIRRDADASALRVTLDTREDFELLRQLIELHGAATLSADEIVDLLARHPDLVALNAHVEQTKIDES